MKPLNLAIGAVVVLALATVASASSGAALPITDLTAHTILTVPVGPGGLASWNEGDVGEGIPTAFCFDATGLVHLLVAHDRSILVCDPATSAIRRIPLTARDGSPLSDAPFLADMAVNAQGHYFVLDTNGRTVLHFDPTGRAVGSFGQILGGDRIEVEPDGTLVVRDAADGALDRFTAGGSFLGYVRDPALIPMVDAQGRYPRAVVVGKHRAFLWLRDRASSMARLLAVLDPRDPGAVIYEAEPLGYDKEGSLYVLTTEKHADLTYVSHVYRYDATGTATAVFRIPSTMEFFSNLPRFHRLLPDGTVVTFATSPTTYKLVGYTPPPAR